jgi:hypothetical protein
VADYSFVVPGLGETRILEKTQLYNRLIDAGLLLSDIIMLYYYHSYIGNPLGSLPESNDW